MSSRIESVSILKDGSAAIYGLGAANGIVLVSTKKGTSNPDGKVDVTLNSKHFVATISVCTQKCQRRRLHDIEK